MSPNVMTIGADKKIKVLRMEAPKAHEERPLTAWTIQVDYRKNDVQQVAEGASSTRPSNNTKGRQFIDALFSHQVSIYLCVCIYVYVFIVVFSLEVLDRFISFVSLSLNLSIFYCI